MASKKEYLDFILGQLSNLENVSSRAMMGEYLLYYHNKIIGGIYDDQLLVKVVPAVKTLMPNAEYQAPYVGAKEMLLVDNVDDREFLERLVIAIYNELPTPKRKK